MLEKERKKEKVRKKVKRGKDLYRILNNNGHIIAFKNNIRISFTEL